VTASQSRSNPQNTMQDTLTLCKYLILKDSVPLSEKTDCFYKARLNQLIYLLLVSNKKTPWPESASELYRRSDHRLSAKLVLIFAGRVPRGQSDGSLRPYSWFSRPEPLLFLSSSSSIVLTRIVHMTHYSSENLVAPGIETGSLDL
jgi:hypothetical protein